MTGRGAARVDGREGRVEAVVSTLNRRGFEAVISLPDALAGREADVERLLRSRIARGSVVCKVSIVPSAGEAACTPDAEAAAKAVGQVRKLAEALGLRDDLTATSLLGLPGVFAPAETAAEDVWAEKTLFAVAQALDALGEARRREGEALRKDLAGRLDRLEALHGEIGRFGEGGEARFREKLLNAVKAAGVEADGETRARILREVAVYAEKADVSEERTRIAVHLAAARRLLETGGCIGRELDFLSQELSREINTLSSKVADAEAGGKAVSFKAELERFREQAQNVE
jgi:uncharacterized protein (TIGR00255 family)